MFDSLKRLALVLVLIALAGATLLLSDQSSRKKTASLIGMMPEKVFQIAIVQHASIPALDDGVAGIVEALSSRGYVNGGKIRIKFFNAQSDAGTATPTPAWS